MRRFMTVALAALLTSMMVSSGGARPPSANALCALTYYCGYESVDFRDRECGWTGSSSNYNVANSCRRILDGASLGRADNIISSYQNWGTGTYSCVTSYQNAGYSIRLWLAPSELFLPGNGVDNWVGAGSNDAASSHTWSDC